MHVSLLREKAPGLFNALGALFVKNESRCFDKWSPAVFEQALNWLYKDNIQMPAQAELRDYTDLYRFAKKYNMEALMNHVVDETRQYCHGRSIAGDIVHSFGGMLKEPHIGGYMSRFLVAQVAHEMVFSENGYEGAGSTADFERFFETDVTTAVKLMFTLRSFQERKFMSKTTKPSAYFACKYHEHFSTPSCKRATNGTSKGSFQARIASAPAGINYNLVQPSTFANGTQAATVDQPITSAEFAATHSEVKKATGDGTTAFLSSYTAISTRSTTQVPLDGGWDARGSTYPQNW